MISRAHGLTLSVLLGAAAATGAYALIATAHLGDAQTKPEVRLEPSDRAARAEARRLGDVAAEDPEGEAPGAATVESLRRRDVRRSSRRRHAAGAGPGHPPGGAADEAEPKAPTRTAAKPAARLPKKRIDAVATPIRDDDAPESAAPVAAPVRQRCRPGNAAGRRRGRRADPGSGPAAAPSSPATLSVEQQCRLLLRAAENKSEQVKQEAERQCEALKNAAERKG